MKNVSFPVRNRDLIEEQTLFMGMELRHGHRYHFNQDSILTRNNETLNMILAIAEMDSLFWAYLLNTERRHLLNVDGRNDIIGHFV